MAYGCTNSVLTLCEDVPTSDEFRFDIATGLKTKSPSVFTERLFPFAPEAGLEPATL
jgi:hypothetical protein